MKEVKITITMDIEDAMEGPLKDYFDKYLLTEFLCEEVENIKGIEVE